MVKGTMKWTNSTKEFGFLAPEDGSRDVFVRLLSWARCGDTTSEQEVCLLPDNDVASTVIPDHGAEAHALASPVEVRTRYQLGQWAPGYEIAGVHESGYQIRRPGSLDILPEVFVPADVRRAGNGR